MNTTDKASSDTEESAFTVICMTPLLCYCSRDESVLVSLSEEFVGTDKSCFTPQVLRGVMNLSLDIG